MIMNAPGPSRSMQRRSPGVESGPPPNIPARTMSPAIGGGMGPGGIGIAPRSSQASARSSHSAGGGSTRRNNVGYEVLLSPSPSCLLVLLISLLPSFPPPPLKPLSSCFVLHVPIHHPLSAFSMHVPIGMTKFMRLVPAGCCRLFAF